MEYVRTVSLPFILHDIQETKLLDSVAYASAPGMEYPQRYAWIMRFDQNGTIVEVCGRHRAYSGLQLGLLIPVTVGACISGFGAGAEGGRFKPVK